MFEKIFFMEKDNQNQLFWGNAHNFDEKGEKDLAMSLRAVIWMFFWRGVLFYIFLGSIFQDFVCIFRILQNYQLSFKKNLKNCFKVRKI